MEDYFTDFIKFLFQQIEEADDFFQPLQIEKLKEIIETYNPALDVSDILVKKYE